MTSIAGVGLPKSVESDSLDKVNCPGRDPGVAGLSDKGRLRNVRVNKEAGMSLRSFVNAIASNVQAAAAAAAVIMAATVCAYAQAAPAPAGAEDPISHADIQRWADAWNSHDIETVLALFTPDVVINQPANPQPLESAGIRSFFGMIFKAYPDFHVDVTDAVVDGLKGVSIERVTGTWSGPYTDPATGQTTPGNGRKFDHPGAMLLTYRPDHKISRVEIYWDQLTVDRQLGVTPK